MVTVKRNSVVSARDRCVGTPEQKQPLEWLRNGCQIHYFLLMKTEDDSGAVGILVLSFGGPEQTGDVMPFLERVVAGRNVPRERLLEVAEHYYALGGKSPINGQCREFVSLLEAELAAAQIRSPVYWGNRNWAPMLEDTLRQMQSDGITRVLTFVTSAFSSHSGCRQYLDDIDKARAALGPKAPAVEKLRGFDNHPEFIGAVADAVFDSVSTVPPERRSSTEVVFTAHSIPIAMADGCDYQAQLRDACAQVGRDVAERLDLHELAYSRAYQSRSGPPQVPWLEPDVLEHLGKLAQKGITDVVVSPIGFLSDHMEVVWDLDHEAKETATRLGLNFHRAATPLHAPRFVAMARELVEERLDGRAPRTVGEGGARRSPCAPGCCAYVRKPSARTV